MKVKLDENIGTRGVGLLQEAGLDVATVSGQKMSSAPDDQVIEACKKEGRCLVALDLHFANPLVFEPSHYPGIAVLRLPPKPAHDDLLDGLKTLICGLESEDIRGRLWIVQRGRIRKYQPGES